MDASNFLESAIRQFEYYKMLGEKTFGQLNDEQLFIRTDPENNSIAVIVQHLHGNMMSRWTDFMTSDGEKEWRKRDSEFETIVETRAQLLQLWEEGWGCLFSALRSIGPLQLNNIIYIRNQGHTVIDAVLRQLAHYPYHVGQIVLIGKIFKKEEWNSLSIPKNNSAQYNAEKFSKEKHREHFTEEFLKKKD